MKKKGLVHVYTGNGKGKTTASLGLALRAVGHGLKVHVIQFMKTNGFSGEHIACEKIPSLRIISFDKKNGASEDIKNKAFRAFSKNVFTPAMEDVPTAMRALKHAEEAIMSKKYDLIILDEINVVLHKKMISTDLVVELMQKKPKKLELVLTGRNAPLKIINAADLVTQMEEIKHPYEEGYIARKGIDY